MSPEEIIEDPGPDPHQGPRRPAANVCRPREYAFADRPLQMTFKPSSDKNFYIHQPV
jgi:hypothetical protein